MIELQFVSDETTIRAKYHGKSYLFRFCHGLGKLSIYLKESESDGYTEYNGMEWVIDTQDRVEMMSAGEKAHYVMDYLTNLHSNRSKNEDSN